MVDGTSAHFTVRMYVSVKQLCVFAAVVQKRAKIARLAKSRRRKRSRSVFGSASQMLAYCLLSAVIGNMGKIGQEYLLNRDGAIPANDDANPKYAEIGRRLMQSGTGIVTEHGILFVDEDIPIVAEGEHGYCFGKLEGLEVE